MRLKLQLLHTTDGGVHTEAAADQEILFTLPLMRKLSPKANRETPTLAAAPIIGFLRAGGRRGQRAASAASRSGYAPESPGNLNSNEQQ